MEERECEEELGRRLEARKGRSMANSPLMSLEREREGEVLLAGKWAD